MKIIETWNKEGMSSTRKLEDDTFEAIREGGIAKVRIFLDVLCRTGASQGLAAYEARKFIREQEKEQKKRKGRQRW